MLKTTATIVVIGCLVCSAIDFGSTDVAQATIPQRALKSDRLPNGTACAQNSWPYYEGGCVRSHTPRQVRIVNIDRLPADIPVVSFAN
jgi:hypothetical protein